MPAAATRIRTSPAAGVGVGEGVGVGVGDGVGVGVAWGLGGPSGWVAGTLPPPGDRIDDSPLAAIFTRSTPFLACERTSVSIACTSLVMTPTPDFGAPIQVG